MARKARAHWLIYAIAAQAIAWAFLMVNGCTSTPKIPNQRASYEEIPFSEILRSPEHYRGKVVRLGGVILDVLNEEKGSTLEILERPLNWRGRPKPGDESGGRFMAVFEGFLDKAVYRPKRPVTIIGEIVGVKTAPLGETVYSYPLFSGREIRLWKEGGSLDRPCIHIGIGVGGEHVGVGVGTTF